MSYFESNPAFFESATEPEPGTYGRGDMYEELAAFHDSINSGSNVRIFSPTQKNIQDFFDGIGSFQARYGENISYSPRMTQSEMGYNPTLTMDRIINDGGYDASAHGTASTMSTDFITPQSPSFDHLQWITAGPAHTSNWATEGFPAFLTYDTVAMAAASMHAPPAQAYSNTANMTYLPPHDTQPTINDYLGYFAESTDIAVPLYLPELMSPGAYDGAAYHQPEPVYPTGPMYTGADADAAYPNPAPVYSGTTFIAPAHTTYPESAPAHHGFTADDWLYAQPQPAHHPPLYAQPDISHGVDPRQLHASSSSIWDPETMREAGLACAAPRTPSLGYSSGSSATSWSPTTPTGPLFPSVRAGGKRRAVDTGFDTDYSTAQISAQTDLRPVKRSRVSQQLARVTSTVDPHAGITNQTGTVALTHSFEYSKASSHGGQHPADLSSEVIQKAGAGPSKAPPKARSRAPKGNVLLPEFVPLYKQGLTAEKMLEAAQTMNTTELVDNLTEKVDVLVPEDGDKYEKRIICKLPDCDMPSKRGAEAARHIRYAHLRQRMPCPKCGKSFRAAYEVKRHINKKGCQKRVHENAKREAKMIKESIETWAGMGGDSTGTEGGSF